jgi:hypothetical protein
MSGEALCKGYSQVTFEIGVGIADYVQDSMVGLLTISDKSIKLGAPNVLGEY